MKNNFFVLCLLKLVDAAASVGWVAPTGIELPEVRLENVTCTSANQVVSAPITIVHALDLDSPGAEFLPAALTAGCPLKLAVATVFDHGPRAGAKTRVQGTMQLRDTTTTPPTVLGQKSFDETLTGPDHGRRGHDHSIDGVPPTVPSLPSARPAGSPEAPQAYGARPPLAVKVAE